ncbi:hypothetical protein QBC37DRAFT_412679 [Rhypophila decipiens]|uniref:PCI domain-containing protein n=1 Tax=Rhypophila decipiens TaxID=261697 RepID=A0AAN7BBZ1_9PEZI|nr:hypothetical protein QBC37DRAFT_412679 [Rhypophila decipiens]
MEQTKALNALEPFLALTKSATSPRAAADLIVRATSAPNTYLFTELLQTQQIQALASSAEFASYLKLLQIFSYGTYSSYIEEASSGLPALNDAQKLKLRQLSLLTLANGSSDETSSPALTYTSLIQNLGLSNARELEELVISTIYAGLINAQLDPKHEQVLINSVAPLRDVAPGPDALAGLLSSLRAWAGRCDASLQSLEEQMAQVRAEADRRAAEGAAWNSKMDTLLKEEEKGATASTNNNGKQTGSMLTHGVNSSPGGSGGGNTRSSGRLQGSGGGSSSAAANNNNPIKTSSRLRQRSKRGAADDGGTDEDEEMELDDENDDYSEGSKKRGNKRKL